MTLRWALRGAAQGELIALDRLLHADRLLWLSCRLTERALTIGLLRDKRKRLRQRSTYATVRILAAVRLARASGDSSTIAKLREELMREASWSSTSSATAHYNAACVMAELARRPELGAPPGWGGPEADIEEAFRHLAEALRRGGRELFAREWLDCDPDLAPLREKPHLPRFTAIVELMTTPGPPEVRRWRGRS